MDNSLYTLNIVGPDGSTVMTSSLWPTSQENLSEVQRANIQGDFYDLSSEESLNNLGNSISDAVEQHYDNFISGESEETVVGEGGEQELQEAGASS